MGEFVDVTEMYLRIIYELEEDGAVALRVRIAERLGVSGSTVSQTVRRMERDGLVVVMGDRHLELTDAGWLRAVSVMRKHRLAERLLVEVIGLEWNLAHVEACRWEHVMSDAVERKIVAMLGGPGESPYGNPVPGLDALSAARPTAGLPALPAAAGLVRLDELARAGGGPAVVRRIAEVAQERPASLRELTEAGILPGHALRVGVPATGRVPVEADEGTTSLPVGLAHLVWVSLSSREDVGQGEAHLAIAKLSR